MNIVARPMAVKECAELPKSTNFQSRRVTHYNKQGLLQPDTTLGTPPR